jgi:hypothetical protein
MSLPQDPAQVGIYGINVVGTPGHDGQLLEAAIRDEPPHDQRLEDRVQSLLLVLHFQLPEQLKAFHAFRVDSVLVFLPARALWIAAVRKPIRHPPHLPTRQRQREAGQTQRDDQ